MPEYEKMKLQHLWSVWFKARKLALWHILSMDD